MSKITASVRSDRVALPGGRRTGRVRVWVVACLATIAFIAGVGAIGPLTDVPASGRPNDRAAEVDVSGDKAVFVSAEPMGGSSEPTSSPVLAAQMT
jgi:hypothetical protein